MALSSDAVALELQQIRLEFGARHHRIEQFWLNRFDRIWQGGDRRPERSRQLLIGAHFCMEYSPESAALFNPSLVWHPDQSNLPAGARRFILSLRATGEGHISAIVFRTGVVTGDGDVTVDEPAPFLIAPEITGLDEDGYQATFAAESLLCERTLFPCTEEESNGMEDARFTEFTSDSGETTYFATYTAYDGRQIRPRILVTSDFLHFKVSTLYGAEASNKGMALFPRPIAGRYAMLSRQDGERIFLMFSDRCDHWDEKILLYQPAHDWDRIQFGNCGAPVATESGWLVLTHGVGAMRKYVLGALLLDLANPAKVVARLREPLLAPNENEREGYVPNVVYSCGGQIQRHRLVLPYAMSDSASSFVTIDVDELLAEMR